MKEAVYIETVHQIEQKLYRIAKRLLISHEEAQDATQEVLVKVWQKIFRALSCQEYRGLCHDHGKKLLL